MNRKKIVGLVLFVFVILNMFIFFQEEAEADVIDYIVLTDAPNGTELVTVVLPVGGKVTAYASAYNFSSGYVGLAYVNWYEFMGLGNLDNSSGTSSTFTAGMSGGLTTILGENTSMINDTFNVTILNPTVDFIQIRSAPGGGGVDLGNPANYPSYPMGSVDTFYGAAYNYTADYIGDVNTNSIWISSNSSIVSVTSPGPSSTINCSSTNWGTVTITLDDKEGKQNTTQVTVLRPSVDFIIIRNAAGGLGSVVGEMTYSVYETDEFYAAGYNATFGYQGDVVVDWWIDAPTVGDVFPTTGTMTTFTADWVAMDSTCTVWADYGGVSNSTGFLTVLTPRVDYLLLTNWAHENGTEIPDMNWNVSEPLPIFASGYNNSLMGPLYIGPIEVNWTDTPDRGDFDNLTGTSTIFTGNSGGLTTIKGENQTLGVSDDFQLNLQAPPGNVDFIIITDSPNGTALGLVTLPVGGQITVYASGYNITSGYVDLVEVNWSDSPDLGSFDNPTGSYTTFTAGSKEGSTTITGQNNTLGISDIFTVNILPPGIDFIILTDIPNGTELTTVILYFGENVTAYASGYNTTSGYFGLIEVNWNESAGLGSLDNLTGTSSTFIAGASSGLTTITGQNDTLGLSDTFDININPPTLDYINITDTPNGTPITMVNLEVWGQVTAYASGYNYSVGYISLIAVNWSESGDLGSFNNLTGTSTTFTAGTVGGSTTIIGENTSLSLGDSFDVYIFPPDVDYIDLTDSPNGTPLTMVTLDVGNNLTIYASAYNNTCGYIGLIYVNWDESMGLGNLDNASGTSTIFTAGFIGGSTTVSGVNLTEGVSDSFDIYINPPTADYIQIRTQPGGGGINLCDPANYKSYPVGAFDTYYGAIYNHTTDYFDDVPNNATWQSSDSLIVMVSSPGSFTDITCDDHNWGTVTITLSIPGIQNTTQVTVIEPAIDYIQIRNEPDGLGNIVTTKTYMVWEVDHFYAAAYNDTADYLGEVEAVWESDDTSVGKVTSPGLWTNFTAQKVESDSMCYVTAEHDGITNSTDALTVLAPRIDYIKIVDSPNGTGQDVGDKTYNEGDSDTFWVAGYNVTADYIKDVKATWESNNTIVGKVTYGPNEYTDFTAGWRGGYCKVTATYGMLSDETGSLFVINFNQLPTARVDFYNGTGFTGGNFSFSIDITLRVTGRKQNIITMGLEEDGVIIEDVEVTRHSGQPDIGMISYNMDVHKVYRVVLTYNGYNGGSNPIIVTFEFLEKIYSIHLLFNSQDGVDQEAIIQFNDVLPLVGVVFFDAFSSSDFEGYLVDFQWNFGDGTTGYGETLAHTFEENDVYTVTLTVIDDEGGSDSSTITVPVENIDNNNQANAIPSQAGAQGYLNNSGECIVILQCPADLLITNNVGNQIGLPNGTQINEIEGAFMAMLYSDIEVYYVPMNDSYSIEVDGTGNGLYNLTVIRVNNDIIKKYAVLNVPCTESTLDIYIFDFKNEEVSISSSEDNKLYSLELSTTPDDQWDFFNLFNMRIDKEATHIYRIKKWEALSLGKPVKLFIDEDGDGTIDKSIDLETGLSGDEIDALLVKSPVPKPAFPILFLIVICSITAIGAGTLLTEVGKWGLLSMFLPLYTRLKKDELLDQPTRYKIYGYILGNPGAYFLLMRQVLELGSGQLVYHLKQLEDAKLIYSRIDGAKKRFYPANVPTSKDGSHHFSDLEEKMLGIIKDNSGIVQKKIASKMGISRQVAGYHLTQMTRLGVIDKEIDGRKTRYYLTEKPSV